MSHVRSQPLLAVPDVEASSRWYEAVLGAVGSHGGPEYQRLTVDGELILQLHDQEVDHHHGAMAEPGVPLGNGIAVWFAVDDFDAAVERIAEAGAEIEFDAHLNPNAGQREIWLRDPDGYRVVLAETTPGT